MFDSEFKNPKILEEIEIAGRDLDKSAILDLVNWFESRVKNILDE